MFLLFVVNIERFILPLMELSISIGSLVLFIKLTKDFHKNIRNNCVNQSNMKIDKIFISVL